MSSESTLCYVAKAQIYCKDGHLSCKIENAIIDLSKLHSIGAWIVCDDADILYEYPMCSIWYARKGIKVRSQP